MFQKSTNQKQEWHVVAMFASGSELNDQSVQRTFQECFLPSFDSYGHAVSEENFVRNQPIRKKKCLRRPCFLTDRDKMSNLYRELVIDTSYQVSIHLANQLQRTFVKIGLFYKQKKNCLWRPCEGFQRRIFKCEKLTEDRRQVMAKANNNNNTRICIASYLNITLSRFTQIIKNIKYQIKVAKHNKCNPLHIYSNDKNYGHKLTRSCFSLICSSKILRVVFPSAHLIGKVSQK